MSALQSQKFLTDYVNQCLHNKSSSHGAPNVYLFDFMFFLVGCGKFCFLMRMSSSKTHMLFLKKNIFLKYILFCGRFITFTTLTFAAFCLLSSFVNNGPRSGQNFPISTFFKESFYTPRIYFNSASCYYCCIEHRESWLQGKGSSYCATQNRLLNMICLWSTTALSLEWKIRRSEELIMFYQANYD